MPPASFAAFRVVTHRWVRPPGGNSTKFAFTYTITQADGTVGKVSFKAVATLLDHRDALPGDNELNSPPVKIT